MPLSYLILSFILVCSAASQAEQLSGFFVLKKKGYGLKNSIFRSISAQNQMTCAHYCAMDESKCQSFNFIADRTIAENCELSFKKAVSLNDANLVPDDEIIYFEKVYKDEEKPEMPENSLALKFRGNNTVEYGISNNSQLQGNFRSISVCFWMNAPASYFGIPRRHATILSYAVPQSENEFLLYLGPDLKVCSGGGIPVSTGVVLADGINRHVCVTWNLSSSVIKTYVNGSYVNSKQVVFLKENIKNGGTWTIGQDQDIIGGKFENRNSFQGKLTEVHVWDKVLDEDEIKSMASSCFPIMKGNIKAYTDFEIKGEVETYIPKCGLD